MKHSIKSVTVLILCSLLLVLMVGCSSDDLFSTAENTNERTQEENDISAALIGTYVGENGSVLTFLSDGTADYYYQPLGTEPVQNQPWSISGNRVTWKYNDLANIYADISNGDVSNLYFKCNNPLFWDDEQYTKVSNEAAHWTIAESDAFLNTNSSEESVEEKEPWDITGSWCEESVEKGNPGMAAYITDDCITLFHVSNNAYIRTPFWICNYEKQQTDSFVLNTNLNKEYSTDCVLLSVDDQKEISYSNGTITFTTSLGDKELKRTEIDFSDDYRNIPTTATSSTIETGDVIFNIPNSFGLYTSESNEYNGDTLRFISGDAVMIISSTQLPDIDLNSFSDKDYKTLIETYTSTILDDYKQSLTNSSTEYDEETIILNSPAHRFKAAGMYRDRINGFHYVDTFGNKDANYFFTVTLNVVGDTTHDYESDFNDIINSIKITTRSTTSSNSNNMPTMPGSSLETAVQKANSLGLKELFDSDFEHGTHCKSLSDPSGGVSIDIIYSDNTHEILCARITTLNLISTAEQKKYTSEMSSVLCPASDANTIYSWAKSNGGTSNSTTINGFTYGYELGPSNNIIYYAGYDEWEGKRKITRLG